MGSYLDKLKNQRAPDMIHDHFELSGEALPLGRMRTFQDQAIKELIAHTYGHSPFYRAKWDQAGVSPEEIRTVADLAKLPFTDKDELRGDPWLLLSCDKKDVSVINVSTGTTGGEQIYVFYTWKDYYINDLAVGYPTLVPVGPGDVCINALPYEMSSAGLAFHKVFMDACGATVVPVGKGGAYSTPDKTVKIMSDLQPTILMTTPSWAVRLAEEAEAVGLDLTKLPLRHAWITGEGCSPAFRDRLEKIWGTRINFYYGSLEVGALGIECDLHRGYHIPLAHAVVEIVEPKTGEVLEPGEIGEIVATCLLRYGSPLVRYRTQDLGYIEEDPCPCGVALPRLSLRGRQVDQVRVGGREFSPFYLEEFLMKLPEVGLWYQFVVPPEGTDRLKIRVELKPGVEPTPELADRLASRMEFGVGVPCEFEFADRLPRPTTKTIRVVHE